MSLNVIYEDSKIDRFTWIEIKINRFKKRYIYHDINKDRSL